MLAGKTIIITGASSGIGRETAIHLSKLGAKCAIIGRRLDRLEEVAAECPGQTKVIAADLNDFDSYDSMVASIVSELGPVSGLVHSAGIEQTQLLQQIQASDLQSIFDINVFSAVRLSSVITKKKYKADQQSIVFVASVMGVVGNKGVISYSATKGALISMVRSMALELASKGVRVNAISPGHISDSEMTIAKEARLPQEANEKTKADHPLGLGNCIDIALSAEFLLSENSRWITGQNLVVDGGYSIR